jgi:hypothetical protein
VQSDALDRLRSEPIDWRSKGFPPTPNPVTPATVAGERWNVLAGDLLLPAMVLRESALEHNLALMARFCREHGVSLAPHGKTTMAPELFRRQLEAGAWGITAATPSQARIFRAFGVERILLANELVEPAAIRWVAAELAADPAFDFYCLADSTATVAAMTEALAGRSDGRPIQVLVELGIEGGRTGCRTLEDGEAVAAAIDTRESCTATRPRTSSGASTRSSTDSRDSCAGSPSATRSPAGRRSCSPPGEAPTSTGSSSACGLRPSSVPTSASSCGAAAI